MTFKIICIIWGVGCILKSLVGLFFHNRFYSWDRQFYSSPYPPRHYRLLCYGLILLFLLTIHTAIYDYVDYGWITVAIITIATFKIVSLTFQWQKVSAILVSFIDSGDKQLWTLDILIALMGTGMLYLAFYVYP